MTTSTSTKAAEMVATGNSETDAEHTPKFICSELLRMAEANGKMDFEEAYTLQKTAYCGSEPYLSHAFRIIGRNRGSAKSVSAYGAGWTIELAAECAAEAFCAELQAANAAADRRGYHTYRCSMTDKDKTVFGEGTHHDQDAGRLLAKYDFYRSQYKREFHMLPFLVGQAVNLQHYDELWTPYEYICFQRLPPTTFSDKVLRDVSLMGSRLEKYVYGNGEQQLPQQMSLPPHDTGKIEDDSAASCSTAQASGMVAGAKVTVGELELSQPVSPHPSSTISTEQPCSSTTRTRTGSELTDADHEELIRFMEGHGKRVAFATPLVQIRGNENKSPSVISDISDDDDDSDHFTGRSSPTGRGISKVGRGEVLKAVMQKRCERKKDSQ